MQNSKIVLDEKLTKDSKKSIWLVPTNLIDVKAGFNIREDLGDIAGLAEQILNDGEIKVTLRGYKTLGRYTITDGHRRYAAVKLLQSQGKGLDIKLPFFLESRGYTDQQRTLDMLITNEGKKLTYIEEAKLYIRLKCDFKMNNVAIGKAVGKSSMHIGNAIMLLDAPNKLQELVALKVISASTLIEQLKKDKDGNITLAKVEKAVANQGAKKESDGGKAVTGGKGIKITKKHLDGVEKEQVTGNVVEAGSIEKTTRKEKVKVAKSLDLVTIERTIKELESFEDMPSEVAAKTLANVVALSKGELTSSTFMAAMLTNLL